MNIKFPINRSKSASVFLSICLALLFAPAGQFRVMAQNQTSAPSSVVEMGRFQLHKFEQPIGEETYEVARDGDTLVTKSNFLFTDRGRRVPLTATLRTRQDLTPQEFEIKGNNSRFSTVDDAIEIKGDAATVRVGKETKETNVPPIFFANAGYAPIAMQQMMVRYWEAHRTSGANSLRTLPDGNVTIEPHGKDTIDLNGKRVALNRYSLSGVIWGRETLWFDDARNLVAAVTIDAEFDHFEAIRDGYESALPFFVSKAADDGMQTLAALAARISPEAKGATAIVGANLIDGTGRAPMNDVTVIIENGIIKQIGARSKVKIPRDAKIVDARGRTLLPGLWDMHAHFEQVEWGPIYLAAGVTTARDVGNEFDFITSVRDAINENRGLGPRLLLAGIVDGDSPFALGIIRANNAEEARAVVDRYHHANFQQMKIYSSVKQDVVKAIAEEAHRLGMTVTGHVPEGMNAFQFVEAGADQINHIQYLPPVMLPKDAKPKNGMPPKIDFDSPEAQNALRFFKDHRTVIDPTLAIFEWSLHPANVPFSTIEPGAAKLPPELVGAINNTGVPPQAAARAQAVFDQYLAIVGALHKAGILIVAGTDQVVPGHSLHREIELYVKAGMTPLEAIQAATIVPARVMKVDKEVGTVETGKRADLILIEGNPLENISNIRNVRFVFTNGRMYDCAQLWQSVGFKP